MVTNNKVLTVSYGTFSCTLEGFDESFETMKAIAEYFRDLAADDRYFGAEPPVPDAEMLTRIAEREISRKVEARTEHGAIVLRAGMAETPPAPMTPGVSAGEAEPEYGAVAEPEPELEPEAMAEAEPEPEVEPEAVAEAESEPEMEPEAVAEAEPEPEAEPEAVAEAEPEPEMEPEAVAEAEPEPEVEPEAVAEAEPEPEMEPEATAAKEEDDDNSIAAKLRRIRAVVSRAEAQSGEEYSEDEHAEDYASESQDIGATGAAVRAPIDDLGDDNSAMDIVETRDFEDETATAAPVRARVIRMKRADFERAVATGLLDESAADAAENTAPPAPDSTEATSLSPEEEADLMAELAEVEAELDTGPEDESADLRDDADDAPEDTAETSEMDEAAEADDETAPVDEEEATTQPAPRLPENSKEGDDLGRILAQTNRQLDEPESTRRRSAIAHLRAAVAATRAERRAGGEDAANKRDAAEPYRSDLAEVMRPARPSRPTREGRGETRRPDRDNSEASPLKLVAEQRVDTTQPQAPVRPRRVAAARPVPSEYESASASSFADYAESMGAEGLPDLLEAAAAYLSYVEGHDQFSRPMLMRLAREAHDADFNREDGLRSFGQLLRQNKIEKIAGGRFTVSEQIGYKPEDRAAG
ncbi:hypothetical protein SAMN04490248_10266 [Salinihabitans flavidus]|uniref:Chemotaxis protein CheA n=1 Tax=Salinihabitans flavidus TaxID=569882 RepID=A0A1H8MFX7_9RHOB|nr:hypothetical protein [Salinihabitans flavidus]SEO16219.1 hypothetical protein SAMN04490248_10266 [Salinihabitans flavidus]